METNIVVQRYIYLWELPLPLLLAERTNVEAELKEVLKQEQLASMYGGFPKAVKAARDKRLQLKESLKYIKAEINHREKNSNG